MSGKILFIEGMQPYIELSMALITPLVAVLGVYIAFQQYRTNKLKLKSDLFDRRYAFFECVYDFVAVIAKEKGVEQSQRDKFIAGTKGAEFLFDIEMKIYVDEIFERAVGAGAWVEDRNKYVDYEKLSLHKKWFNTQLRTINSRFKKYMSLSH